MWTLLVYHKIVVTKADILTYTTAATNVELWNDLYSIEMSQLFQSVSAIIISHIMIFRIKIAT